MNTTKTLDKWELTFDNYGPAYIRLSANPHIMVCGFSKGDRPTHEGAALMNSAPSLVKTLRSIKYRLLWQDYDGVLSDNDQAIIRDIDEALAKATGVEQCH